MLGLVDNFGGLAEAIEFARGEAKLDRDLMGLRFYPTPGGVFETYGESTMESRWNKSLQLYQELSKTKNWLIKP